MNDENKPKKSKLDDILSAHLKPKEDKKEVNTADGKVTPKRIIELTSEAVIQKDTQLEKQKTHTSESAKKEGGQEALPEKVDAKEKIKIKTDQEPSAEEGD